MSMSYSPSSRCLQTLSLATELAQISGLPPAERLGQLAMLADELPPSMWLKLLGRLWDSLPRVSGWEDYLLTRTPVGATRWPVVELMTADELAAFIALPDDFLAYRGALAHNHAGLCWSLEMARAATYAERYAERFVRAGHPRPVAYRLTARIDKSQVIAVKRVDSEVTLLIAQVDYLCTEIMPTAILVQM